MHERTECLVAGFTELISFPEFSFSRFDLMITFGLPDERNRQEIAAQYAKQLTKPELNEFARITEG